MSGTFDIHGFRSTNGLCTDTSVLSTVQVSRIAAAFSIQPCIHLIKEFENSVVFRNESSGKSNPSGSGVGALYDV